MMIPGFWPVMIPGFWPVMIPGFGPAIIPGFVRLCVSDLKNKYGSLLDGAVTKQVAGDKVIWQTEPLAILPGTK